MRDKNLRQEPGGRRDDTCDHGLSRSWKVEVCKKKKKGQLDQGCRRDHIHQGVYNSFGQAVNACTTGNPSLADILLEISTINDFCNRKFNSRDILLGISIGSDACHGRGAPFVSINSKVRDAYSTPHKLTRVECLG